MSLVETAPAARPILLIDDEPAILELLTGILEGEGYRCHIALNGADGLHIFHERKDEIGVVTSCFYNHVNTAFELTRAIRAGRPNMKVIPSRSILGHRERAVATELIVDALLPKPCNAAQVLECID